MDVRNDSADDQRRVGLGAAMDIEKITALIQLVGSSSIAELELQEGASRVRIVRSAAAGGRPAAAFPQFPVPASPEAPATMAAEPASAPAAAGSEQAVLSPMVGTFYRRPSPNEPPFVEVGDVVEAGQTLALVEAMKTLNPVAAERGGTVREILVADAEMVEEDQRLFVIA